MLSAAGELKKRMGQLNLPLGTIAACMDVATSFLYAVLAGNRSQDRLNEIARIVEAVEELTEAVRPLKLDFTDAQLVKSWIHDRDAAQRSAVSISAGAAALAALEVIAGQVVPDSGDAEAWATYCKKLKQINSGAPTTKEAENEHI